MLAASKKTDKPDHWVVLVNYRYRAGSFVMAAAIIGAHLLGKAYGPLAWGLLAMQFLLYPHLLYWRARYSRDPLRAELNNLLLDALLLGVWVAALGFPLWISFALFVSTAINLTTFRGPQGIAQASAALLGGMLLGIAIFGLRLSLSTDAVVTALSIVGLAIYLLMVVNGAYSRALKLREVRARLRLSEQELQAANDTLRGQLDEIHALQSQLKEQANRDSLTGLYNRRYLDATIERELQRCKREGHALSLVLIDIDHFKGINDTFGHQAGDAVLKHMAGLLLEHSRGADVVCRYGGEEFLLLLPGMPQAVALERAESYRAALESANIQFGEFEIKATLSIGLSCYPGHGKSPDELIGRADEALYRAKSQGRNRIVLFDAETDTA